MTRGFCLWFTGLPSSGKSTLALRVADALRKQGRTVEVLDGDEVRKRLSKGLGFSREDRDANILRIAFVARAIVEAGGVAITCAISPYRATRRQARSEIPNFVEAYVSSPLETCIQRDVKGLYRKALAGEIQNFTGISDPYEPPENPEINVPTHLESVEASVRRILDALRSLGYLDDGLPPPHGGRLIDRVVPEELREKTGREAAGLPAIELTDEQADDAWNLAHGVFSPLEGFMNEEELTGVVEKRRLPGGASWTLPILLDTDRSDVPDRVALTWRGEGIAVLEDARAFTFDPAKLSRAVFGTTDERHPGVARVRGFRPNLVGGKIRLFRIPQGPLARYRLTPAQARERFREAGFKSIAAFQTRNPPHIAHEFLQKLALNQCDGLFIHPVVGPKKPGDFRDEVILRCYEVLIRRFHPAERVILGTLHTWMRYAGPMEAIFHGIVRQNFGCTHLIVGRDHAGAGAYYPPFAAQEIFSEFPDLRIRPIRVSAAFYCRACAMFTTERACPHKPEDRVAVSGTRIREAIQDPSARLEYALRDEILAVIREFDHPFVE